MSLQCKTIPSHEAADYIEKRYSHKFLGLRGNTEPQALAGELKALGWEVDWRRERAPYVLGTLGVEIARWRHSFAPLWTRFPLCWPRPVTPRHYGDMRKPRGKGRERPVVFYGTGLSSLAQGNVATWKRINTRRGGPLSRSLPEKGGVMGRA